MTLIFETFFLDFEINLCPKRAYEFCHLRIKEVCIQNFIKIFRVTSQIDNVDSAGQYFCYALAVWKILILHKAMR